jgi:two-component system nitrate/nitrite response regulator NarL
MNTLTKREEVLVGHVARGLTNKEIGAAMGIAPSTAKTYISRIFEKLDIHNRTALALWAVDRGQRDDVRDGAGRADT